jgi:4-hydroxybenzoyl-CoA reductase subunit beta
MTLPMFPFRILSPASVEAAVAARREHADSRFLAGGTDVIVNLRRGLGGTDVLIDLNGVKEIGGLNASDAGARIGAGATLVALARNADIGARYPVVRQAALGVAGPGHRNLATVGGNLCLDTRCIYYNQSEWWRRANGYCLKYGGEICHVAPQGQRCHAAFSGDLAPAFMVLDAQVEIAGSGGRRRIPLAGLYVEDGRAHLALAEGELLVAVHLPPHPPGAAYAKARVRGSMDFPLAGVAVALALEAGRISALRIALTGTNSCPVLLEGTAEFAGEAVDDATLDRLEKRVQKQVQPMRTTIASGNYRRMAAAALARRLVQRLAAQAAEES